MDVNGLRRANTAFSHYGTSNLDMISFSLDAYDIDAEDGTFSVFKSNKKDDDSFTALQDDTPIDIVVTMDGLTAGDGHKDLVIDPFPYKYFRIDWTPNSVSDGEVQVKVNKPSYKPLSI